MKIHQGKEGFTLLEIIVILAILAIVAALVLPSFTSALQKSKAIALKGQFEKLKEACLAFNIDTGGWPVEYSDDPGKSQLVRNVPPVPLWNGPYLSRPLITNPWGGVVRIRSDSQQHFFVAGLPVANPCYLEYTKVPDEVCQEIDRELDGALGATEGVVIYASGALRILIVGNAVAALAPLPPTVTTQEATNIGTSCATLNMHYDFKDYGSGQVRFAYKKSSAPSWSYTSWVDKSGSGPYSETISGLCSNTSYQFKAQLKYDSTVIEGSAKSFVTLKKEASVKTESVKGYYWFYCWNGYWFGCIQVTARIDYGDYNSVQVRIGYRKQGESWHHTHWETSSSTRYVKCICGWWKAGATYEFEAMIRFDSQYAYGGIKSIRIPRWHPPQPPNPPSP